jgi:hypothetical protein
LYGLLLSATAIARFPGLKPASLWWDDLWVATLAKGSLPEVLTIPNPNPPGFLLILWILRRVIPSPEWSLQLFPFLCGLAVVPLTGAVVSRVTESALLGLAAAATIALNPLLAHYSVFVKAFTLDASATAALLLVTLTALDRLSVTTLWAVVALGLLAFFFSLNSILASFLLVHLLCLYSLTDARRNLRALGARLLPAIAFDLILLVWFELDVRGRSNPLLQEFWSRYFLRTASPGRAVHFLMTRGWDALREALPEPIQEFSLLALPGLAAIAMRHARLGVFLALYLLEILTLSRLHYVPLGARTESFAIPVFVLLIFAAFDLVPRSIPGRRVLHGALATAAIVFAVRDPFPSRYYDVDDAFTVEELAKLAGPDDAVLVYPSASWLVAYYSGWPYDLHLTDDWASGFQPWFRLAHVLVLTTHTNQIAETRPSFFDRRRFSKIFYIATRLKYRALPKSRVFAELSQRGYQGRLLLRSEKSVLYVFRPSPPDRHESAAPVE